MKVRPRYVEARRLTTRLSGLCHHIPIVFNALNICFKQTYRCLEVVGGPEIVASLDRGEDVGVVGVDYLAAARIYEVDALGLSHF